LPPNIRENAGYLIGACIKGIELLKKYEIDLIHSNTYSPAFAGQFCASLFRKPHVITFHDLYLLGNNRIWESWARQPGISHLTGFIAPLIERLSLMLPATIIHTVSETSKKEISQYVKNKSKIVIIPNGLLLEDYECDGSEPNFIKDSKSPLALYIGRLVYYKNLQTILSCFDRVLKEKPSAKLVIVGDGPFRSELERAAKHLDGNVVFTGRVSHDEKLRLLNESSFLILPSLVEGFGIVILEAYACRKPVLVSSVRPLTEIVENGKDGYFVAPFDECAWTEKMTELFRDAHRTRKMGNYGREKLEQRYTIQKIVDDLENLYCAIIES
jgi:glycosyltransferase involved in cell wall biosynthesis